jgi:glycosyltransferase involved in cell wall biosynthesis
MAISNTGRSLPFPAATDSNVHKALFIAYNFPPCIEIGGSIRSEKFVKYLPGFGWQPHILSLSNHRSQIGKAEIYPGVQRLPSLTPWNRPYKFALYGWLAPLYYHARKTIKKDRYDLIYVSCPPFPTSFVAARIKRMSALPLVVDYRDAWTLGPYKNSSKMSKIISRILFPWMEKNVLSDVDGLIVNTPSALDGYQAAFPHLNGRIIMVPNGYDEKDFKDYRTGQNKDKMILLHCGRFGVAGRNPICFLAAIKRLIERQIRIQLRIIGDQGSDFDHRIADLGLSRFVQVVGQVPHRTAIESMGQCDVLVIYQEQYNTQITPIAGKTYEYLRSGKPILAITPPGDNLDLIQQYAHRYETAAPDDAAAVARSVYALYDDWKQDRFKKYEAPQNDYRKLFNREVLAARLAEFFNQIVTKTN